MWDLYSDGGAAPNPGPGAYCAALYKEGVLVESAGGFLPKTTNNVAEYRGFLSGLRLMKDNCTSDDIIVAHLDSQLVLKQVTGEWKVKERSLQELCTQCTTISSAFSNLQMKWVKGHSGDIGNEYVDSVCTQLIRMSVNNKLGSDERTSDSDPDFEPDIETDNKRLYISCPFSEKDEVKAMGARWDPDKRKWWVSNDYINRIKFSKWIE